MDFLAAIRRESDLFYTTAEGTDPDRRVPSCPDWTVADLVWHLGGVHWFWATDVERRALDPIQFEKEKPPQPDDYGELVAWGRLQVDRLISVLAATADEVPVWTWGLDESQHTVGFVRRHQVQEAAVHRWDIQSAAGTDPPDPIDAEAASDAIDEVLAVTLPWGVKPPTPLPGSVHIHCTDTPGEWLVHTDGRVEPVHGKGDVAIRGTASDILLALYERHRIEDLDLVGDAGFARVLVERINTE